MAAERILFAVDVDSEVSQEAAQGSSRLDIIKQCISYFISNKRRVNAGHLFGIAALDDKATMLSKGLSGSGEELEAAVQKLQPQAQPCQQLELSCLMPLVQSLGEKVRVVLVYSRSKVAPSCRLGAGIAMDVVYIHEKPVAGVNCPQEVYNSLEEQVDSLGKAVGHNAYIYEATAQNVKKVFGLMVWLMAHPATRPTQQLVAYPPDLATAPFLSNAAAPSPSAGPTSPPHYSSPTPPPLLSGPHFPPLPSTSPPFVAAAPPPTAVPLFTPSGTSPPHFSHLSHPAQTPHSGGTATSSYSSPPAHASAPAPAAPPGATLLGAFNSAAEAAAAASQLQRGGSGALVYQTSPQQQQPGTHS